jgi:hypothetical protein
MPWRRRGRVRRVLNRLRAIKRLNSTWLDYYRIQTEIFVIISSEQTLTLFLLSWPQELPEWHRHSVDQLINKQNPTTVS